MKKTFATIAFFAALYCAALFTLFHYGAKLLHKPPAMQEIELPDVHFKE